MTLLDALRPCGPVIDEKAAERTRGRLGETAEAAWPVLAPVFGASPYLAGLAARDPARLAALLQAEPQARLDDILARTRAAAQAPTDEAARTLRALKAELHLLTALADLGGVWSLDEVTGALTRFADAAVASALTVAARAELEE